MIHYGTVRAVAPSMVLERLQLFVYCRPVQSVARDYRENIIAKTNTANTFTANVDNRENEYSECRLQRMQIP
jgi:hypothetical protein